MIVDTLIFDAAQVTCPTHGLNPRWGGVSRTHGRSRTNYSDYKDEE